MRTSYSNASTSGVLLGVAIIGALYLGRVVFIPLALAVLFSILLSPVIAFLERCHIPRFLGIVLIVVIMLGGAGFAGWKTSQQFADLSDQLPMYRKTLEDKIHFLHTLHSESLTKATSTVQELEKEVAAATPVVPGADDNRKGGPGSSPSKPLAVQVVPPTNPLESLESMLGPIANAFVVAVFTVFILMGQGRPAKSNRAPGWREPPERDHPSAGRRNAPHRSLPAATTDRQRVLRLDHRSCFAFSGHSARVHMGNWRRRFAFSALPGTPAGCGNSDSAFACGVSRMGKCVCDDGNLFHARGDRLEFRGAILVWCARWDFRRWRFWWRRFSGR